MATRQIFEVRPGTPRLTRVEYDRLIARGVLEEDEPIELLAGELVLKEPQAGPHATAVQLVQQTLQRALRREECER